MAEPVADVRQLFALVIKGERGGVFGDFQLGLAAADGQSALKFLHVQGQVFQFHLEPGLLLGAAHEVERLDTDDVGFGGGKEQLQHGAPHGPRIVGVRHGVEIDAVALHLDFADLDAVGVFHTRTVHPVAFCKFHDNTSF